MIEECFAPLPILSIPLFDQEVVGQEVAGMPMLRVMGKALFLVGLPISEAKFDEGKIKIRFEHGKEKPGKAYLEVRDMTERLF